jgi:hypothetical protein
MKPLPYINTSGERKELAQMQIEHHVSTLMVLQRAETFTRLTSRGRCAGLAAQLAELGDRSQRAPNMTLDPSSQNSGTEQLTPDTHGLTPDTHGLQSLALDAYLTGHQQVAHNLADLGNRLIETKGCSPLRAVVKEILARANAPGQDFATLLDPFPGCERIPAGQSPDGE